MEEPKEPDLLPASPPTCPPLTSQEPLRPSKQHKRLRRRHYPPQKDKNIWGKTVQQQQQPARFILVPSLLPSHGGTQRTRPAPGFSSDPPSTHLLGAASTLQAAQEPPPTPLSSRSLLQTGLFSHVGREK
ncbi:hypothetical protein E2320_014445 [Naja naja]|nr:hypothetical protein E2320_014445 [Naja naja]